MKELMTELKKLFEDGAGASTGGAMASSASLGAAPTPAMGQVTVNGKPWTTGKSYKAKKHKSKKVKESYSDPLFTVNIGNDFIAGADVYSYPGSYQGTPLYEVAFFAKDKDDKVIPIYIAKGLMYPDGNWNIVPAPIEELYSLSDAELKKELLDKWNEFRFTSLAYDNLLSEITDKIEKLPTTKNESSDYEMEKAYADRTIYMPSTVSQAYHLEKKWYDSLGLEENEQAPEVMLFVIDNGKDIKDTKLIKREDVYTYEPAENEYYLDRTRDTGSIITDYNLAPAQKLVYSWNKGRAYNESCFTVISRLSNILEECGELNKIPDKIINKALNNKINEDTGYEVCLLKYTEDGDIEEYASSIETSFADAKAKGKELLKPYLQSSDNFIVTIEKGSFKWSGRNSFGTGNFVYGFSNKNMKTTMQFLGNDYYDFKNVDFHEAKMNEISDKLADLVNDKRHQQAHDKGEVAKKAFVNDAPDWRQKSKELWDAGLKAKKNDELYKKRRFKKEFPNGQMSREDALDYQQRDELERNFGKPLKGKDFKLGRMKETADYVYELKNKKTGRTIWGHTRNIPGYVFTGKKLQNDPDRNDTTKKYQNESKINEISDKLAGKTLGKRIAQARKATNDYLRSYSNTSDVDGMEWSKSIDRMLDKTEKARNLYKKVVYDRNADADLKENPDTQSISDILAYFEDNNYIKRIKSIWDTDILDALKELPDSENITYDLVLDVLEYFEENGYIQKTRPIWDTDLYDAVNSLSSINEAEEPVPYEVEIWSALDPENPHSNGFTSMRIDHDTFDTPEQAKDWADSWIKRNSKPNGTKYYFTVTKGDKIVADSRKLSEDFNDGVDYAGLEKTLTENLENLDFEKVDGENAFVYEYAGPSNYKHQISYYKQPAEITYRIYDDLNMETLFEERAEAKSAEDINKFFKDIVKPEFDQYE